MVWIDSHSHLSQAHLEKGEQAFVQDYQTARAAGVQAFLQGGTDPENWLLQLELKKRFPALLLGLGLHPYFVADHSQDECDQALDQLAGLAYDTWVLGETGLDFRTRYLHEGTALDSRDRQLECFQNQIDLAVFLEKPLVLHVVRAFDEAHRMIEFSQARRGIVHGFNGSVPQAEAWVRLGFAISVGAQILKPDNLRLQQAVQACNPDFLLVESDDLAPISILQVADKIAQLKSGKHDQKQGGPVTREQILDKSTSNLLRILKRGISDL